MIATCPEELKGVVVKELEALKVTEIEPGYRAVQFSVDEEGFYRVHLWVRTASRLLRVLKDFSASRKEIVFDQTRRIRWPDVFSPDHSFAVETFGGDSTEGALQLGAINDKVREGVLQSFTNLVNKAPKVTRRDARVSVVAFVRKGRCILSIDTSGKGLHKRGYREEGHPAPMKETLAAGVLSLLGYDGSQTLLDPMCGSGTLVIEAAQMAVRKAPFIHRAKGDFGFEWLKFFRNEVWRKVQDQAREGQLESPPHPIYASDMSGAFVDLARRCALKARVEKFIQFDVKRFQEQSATVPAGLIVANLPYAERLGEDKEILALYKQVGDVLKSKFSGWRAGLLMPDAMPSGAIGLKPTKTLKLLNGSIKVKLLIIDMYAGSKRVPKANLV